MNYGCNLREKEDCKGHFSKILSESLKEHSRKCPQKYYQKISKTTKVFFLRTRVLNDLRQNKKDPVIPPYHGIWVILLILENSKHYYLKAINRTSLKMHA